MSDNAVKCPVCPGAFVSWKRLRWHLRWKLISNDRQHGLASRRFLDEFKHGSKP